MHKKTYRISYPEHRTVTAHQIETWYADRVASEELEPNDYLDSDTDGRAEALHDYGFITLCREYGS
jgi:hypothetical protein